VVRGTFLPARAWRRRPLSSNVRPQIPEPRDCATAGLVAASESPIPTMEFYLKPLTIATVAFGVILNFAATASANVITITETVDANAFSTNNTLFGSSPAFFLAVGDTLNLNYRFLPGQVVQVDGLIVMGAGLGRPIDGPPQTAVTISSQMSFQGLVGPAHDPLPKTSTPTSNGSFGISTAFWADEILDSPPSGTFSFTGVNFMIQVLSYSDNSNSKLYETNSFAILAQDITVSPVPEASSGILSLFGIALLGTFVFWRRAQYS